MDRWLCVIALSSVVAGCGDSSADPGTDSGTDADAGIPRRPPPGTGPDAETSSCAAAGATCNGRECCPDSLCAELDGLNVCASLCRQDGECQSLCCLKAPNDDRLHVCSPSALCGIDPPPPPPCEMVVRGDDGVYLGAAHSEPAIPEGVCNPNGNYGSAFGMQSIFNTQGTYGSDWSDLSAQNPRAARPPHLMCRDTRSLVARVTKNASIPGAVDPDALCAYLRGLGS